MRCQYYQESPVVRCCAFLRGLKVPSKAEIGKLCTNGVRYLKCPTFLKKEKDVEKIAC